MASDAWRLADTAGWYACLAALIVCGAVGWRRSRRAGVLLLAAAGVFALWQVPGWVGIPYEEVFGRLGGTDRRSLFVTEMWVRSVSEGVLTGLLLAAVLVGRRPPAGDD